MTVVAAMPARAEEGKGVPPAGRIAFKVFRDGTPFGTHVVVIEHTGDTQHVEVAIDYAARFAGITLFRYRHRNVEQWQAGRLVRLDSTTDRDGQPHSVTVRKGDTGLIVEGTEARYTAPFETCTTTWWNPARLLPRLIDTQGGRLHALTITPRGREMLVVPSGRIPADHFTVQGALTLEAWYDEAGVWCGFSFAARGAQIRYEPMA